ncbi:DDHD domain-containing protein [Dichotomocladium elegans]|nr:DDHD domain-containing protein [Dichotomocladium elegans]
MLDSDPGPAAAASDKKSPALLFPVKNFFALGSPLGVILLLRGYKIAPRKCLDGASPGKQINDFGDMTSTSSTVSYCYPAVENLYNVFHKSDPVAYRLEPLIARQYSANLKPVPITYIKGGLKSVIDAGFSVGSGIANRAGAMYESFKLGFTTNLFMRGFGIAKTMDDERNGVTDANSTEQAVATVASTYVGDQGDDSHSLRSRSRSDPPSLPGKFRNRSASTATELPGAEKLRLLNRTGRVDFCLQEGILENPYFSAFSAHMQYWQDLDVAAFLVREIYRD